MSLQAVSTVRSIRQSTPARSWSDGRDAIHTAVRELRKHHPRAGEQQIAHLLTEQLEVDGELLEAGAIYLAHDAMTRRAGPPCPISADAPAKIRLFRPRPQASPR